jgi:PAS domain S-box-containing protein
MNSEKSYVDLIRALNNAAIITETDLTGRIISVNAQFCRLSGYSEEELVGMPHNIVNSGTHSKDFFTGMWKTISSGKVWIGEVCNRAKEGHLYWVHATVFPVFYEDSSEIYKYAAIRFDITEKKKTEQELKRSASRYQAVIETTDGFCHVDTAGFFLEVSDNYCEITGYTRSELLTMNITDMDATESEVDRNANLKHIISGNGKTFEMNRRRKNNSIWSAEITATYSPIDNGSVFVFLHDITERKEMEKRHEDLRQQLNHMQKLDSIGRLTAGIAHDFNNILASILGYTEMSQLISEDMPDGDLKTDLANNLRQVDIAGKRAAELIEKMMTYCRQSSPKKIVETKPTAQVINEVVKMLQAGLTEAIKIELTLDKTPDIIVDSIELHQVLTNLLVNARDAMKGQGIIKIKLTVVEKLSCLCDACLTPIEGDFIELSVSDNGTGIDEKMIARIFDPFFTTKSVGEGTGLGLSMVSGIVHHSRGHILIDSEFGAGTTFKLLFPVDILWRRATDSSSINVLDDLSVRGLNRRATDVS